MKAYTRVLKGHVGLATATFPDGTPGFMIDAFARRHLWEAGLDYQHGTGHGVGAALNVHEGPHVCILCLSVFFCLVLPPSSKSFVIRRGLLSNIDDVTTIQWILPFNPLTATTNFDCDCDGLEQCFFTFMTPISQTFDSCICLHTFPPLVS